MLRLASDSPTLPFFFLIRTNLRRLSQIRPIHANFAKNGNQYSWNGHRIMPIPVDTAIEIGWFRPKQSPKWAAAAILLLHVALFKKKKKKKEEKDEKKQKKKKKGWKKN